MATLKQFFLNQPPNRHSVFRHVSGSLRRICEENDIPIRSTTTTTNNTMRSLYDTVYE